MSDNAARYICTGLCWLGFWIGLGLYNMQGCVPQAKFAHNISKSENEAK